MFNPFAPFTIDLLNAFVQAGKKYFVRQTFPRGKSIMEPDLKGSYLYTHYNDAGSAQTHLSIIKDDPHRFLFDWTIEDHKLRLVKAANGMEGYKIYSSMLYDDVDKLVPQKLKSSMMAYLKYKLNWYPSRNDNLQFQFYPQMGELYIEMKFRNKEVRIPVSEIENFKG